jgi:hypothetical protein
MRSCRWRALLCHVCCVTLVLGLPVRSQAYVLPVIDGANLLQSVIHTLQTTYIVANQALELLGVAEMVLDDEYSETLHHLAGIVHEAGGLAQDITSLQRQVTLLFDLHHAPRSATELDIRLREIRTITYESYVFALRVQTLVTTIYSTIRHATRLIAAVDALAGNKQSQQTLIQLNGKMVQLLTQMHTQTAAYERAQSVERLTEAVTIESIHLINIEIMGDHPR